MLKEHGRDEISVLHLIPIAIEKNVNFVSPPLQNDGWVEELCVCITFLDQGSPGFFPLECFLKEKILVISS